MQHITLNSEAIPVVPLTWVLKNQVIPAETLKLARLQGNLVRNYYFS